jgi:hypothetical protein
MFRASSCPSSRAYKLQQPPLVYRWNVVVAVSLVVVGPAGPTTTNDTAFQEATLINKYFVLYVHATFVSQVPSSLTRLKAFFLIS